MPAPRRAGAQTLVDRDDHLAELDRLTAEVLAGRTKLAVVSGGPGTGRSALLAAVAAAAAQAGLRVVAVRCAPQDRSIRNGLITELTVAAAPTGHPVRRDPALAAESAFPPEHGEQPLAVIVDDAQWADTESARRLWAVAGRDGGTPLLVVVAVNSFDGDDVDLVATAVDARVHLTPLRGPGVRMLLTRRGGAPDDAFVDAVLRLTGGNPAVLTDALDRFPSDAGYTADSVRVFADAAADARAEHVTRVLDGLPDPLVALLRAVAVSHGNLDCPLVGALAGVHLPPRATTTALLGTGLVRTDGDTLVLDDEVAERVLAAMPAAQRRNLYARAATLGRAAAVPDDALGRMLLHGDPIGDEWAVRVLQAAARTAVADQQPVLAAELLGRALQEPGTEALRAELLVQLSTVEARLRPESATRRLRQVLVESADTEVAHRLDAADLLLCLGDNAFTERNIGSLWNRTGIGDRERGTLLGLYWLADHNRHSQPDPSIPVIDRLPATPTDPVQAACAAAMTAAAGVRLTESCALARTALLPVLTGERLFSPRIAAARALAFAERIDEALHVLDEVIADALARGVRVAADVAHYARADVGLRSGRLTVVDESIAEVRAGVPRGRWHPILATKMLAIEVELHVTRDELDAAERTAAAAPGRSVGEYGVGWTRMLYARGQLDVAAGRPERAVAQLREVGRRMSAAGWTNPAAMLWRSYAALAHHTSGQPDAAARLSDEDTERAAAWGARGTLGRVHLLAGIATGDAERLRTAVWLLRESQDRLRYATALIELAAATTDSGDSVGPLLREATELVSANGWRHLAPRVAELSRRQAGVEELSDAQYRVAELAATGISNGEIAAALSVTRRTVELHLTNVYRKLGIAGRDELRAALHRLGTDR